jgi:hypothetical protein
MSDEINAADILDRFRLNECGALVYSRDIQSSGAIRKREGAPVKFKTDTHGVRGLCFRQNGKRFWISAGAAAFVIAYNSLPLYPGVMIIKPSDSNPDDYRAENLTYNLMSDIKHKGAMRIRACSGGFQSQIYINGVRIVRFFHAENDAKRFTSRLSRFNSSKLFREFWAGAQISPEAPQ